MVFRVFREDETTLTAELDRIYYDGVSSSFTVIDENDNYISAVIISEEANDNFRKYNLQVEALKSGANYYVSDQRFLRTPLKYRNFVKAESFDEMYYYSGNDLGSLYSKKKTTFSVWTPISSRVLLDLEGFGLYEMERGEYGVYRITVKGNLAGIPYQYMANISGEWRTANDPYAFSSTSNHKKSVVIDTDSLKKSLNKDKLPPLAQKTDALIYELHVRDFSSSTTGGFKHQGKFLGFTESGTKNLYGHSTGLDYLTELGITHIQLLPVFDFGSVDELNQMEHYNWGYDPVQYNVPEGSYSTDSTDPICRIIELQQVVSVLHSKGIRVIMDVVYNHMFDRYTSDFEQLVPGYYFRTGQNGEVSNGSFCGNDIDSNRLMVRKYILDSIKRWMTLYGMDGFRFDLMGILDIETMNRIEEEAKAIDPAVMIYGEGWNMPTFLPDDQKASMMNHGKLTGISFFNDYFRDTMKGDTMMDKIHHKGLLTGETRHLERMAGLLLGSQYNSRGESFFSAPWKSINYVECHDNHTSFDKMIAAGVKESERIPRQKLMIGAVIFSRGIPFLHGGQEMCRTKGGDHNSYRSSDDVNAIDWNLRSIHRDLIKYTEDAIEMRKNTGVFRVTEYGDNTEYVIDKHSKLVTIKYSDGTSLIVNADSHHTHEIPLSEECVVFNRNGKVEIFGNHYTIKELELIIIKKILGD